MKSKLSILAIAACSFLGTISNPVYSQKYGKGIVGLGNHNVDITHIGYFGETEVFSMPVPTTFGGVTHRLYAYNNKKKVGQESLSITFNGKKYVPEELLITDKQFVGFFIASEGEGKDASLYVQNFGEDLKAKGQARKIVDLPYAMDGDKFKSTYGTPLFVKEPVKHQSLHMLHNPATGSVVLTFSLKYDGKVQTSYAKAIVLDDNFSTVLVQDYKAKSADNILKVDLKKLYDNNDAFFSINEGVIEKVKGSDQFNILRSAMVFVPGNGSEIIESELEGDKERLRNIVVSEDKNASGMYYYAIQTEGKDKDYGNVGIYTFNPKNGNTQRTSAKLEGRVTLPKVSEMSHFNINKLYALKDNAVLLDFYGGNSGSIAMKVTLDGDVSWATFARPAVNGQWYCRSTLTNISDDVYQYIFNIHPNMMKGGKMNMEKAATVDFGSTPCTAQVDLSTGKVTHKLLDGKGNTLGAINFNGSRTKTNGEYQLRMKFNGKIQTVPVSFN